MKEKLTCKIKIYPRYYLIFFFFYRSTNFYSQCLKNNKKNIKNIKNIYIKPDGRGEKYNCS